jgi:precorrin-6A/cobalt-precorrin-6A reductase
MPTIVSQGSTGASVISNILILGGTTEASALAVVLAERSAQATLSYAGRTDRPRAQPVPIRIGGFGGVEGLTTYLRDHGITHLVDATHPFAATMSAHAVKAAERAGAEHIALTRPPWEPVAGDDWHHVADIDAAVAALAGPARRVMLALGRMHVQAFGAQGQHHYLLRFVDAADDVPGLLHYSLIVDRGPFTVEGDTALLRQHGIDLVVCKNAGGKGAEAKLIAARALGLPVIMIDRPALPPRRTVYDVDAVLRWLDHGADRGV